MNTCTSRLCHRIHLYESLTKVNDDGFVEARRLLSNYLDITTIQSNNIKTIFLETATLSHEKLATLKEEMDKISSDPQYTHSNKQLIQSDSSFSSMLELPNDLIVKTAIFLNEKDIFEFEQCCRLIYKLINNTSHLNQSKNFKKLKITNHKLDQIRRLKCSFFKYCKAKDLEIGMTTTQSRDARQEVIQTMVTTLHGSWDLAQKSWINDGWFKIIFQSINTLTFAADGMFFLDKMPIELLFDPQSQLKCVSFNHYWHTDQYGKKTDRISAQRSKMVKVYT